MLLENGAEVNFQSTDPWKATPLHIALSNTNPLILVIRKKIKKKKKLNSKN